VDDWRRDALCLEHDPRLFYPPPPSAGGTHIAEEAKAICKRCPVREECLEWALEHGEQFGIWGGRTERERRRIRQRLAELSA